MAMKLCAANKHYYDQLLHADCPYCSGEGSVAVAAVGTQAAAPKTQMVVAEEGVKTQIYVAEAASVSAAAVHEGASPPAAGADVDVASAGGPAFPVVAWLVVVAGPGRGSDFRLIQGENRIGTAPELEVCLDFGADSDPHLDAAVQAVVVYDHHANEFFIERGNSRQLPQLNGSTIRGEPTLAAGDRIQVGQTQLLFWPLCGADFCWRAP